MNLPELETRIGLGNGTISRWRTSAPNTDKLTKIADYFNVTVDYLMTGEEKESQQYYLNDETKQIAQKIFENKELRILFDASRKAKPEDLLFAAEMIKKLKEEENND